MPNDLRRKHLEDQLAQLKLQYEATSNQYLSTMDASTKVTLNTRLKQLETEIQKAEQELAEIGGESPRSQPDSGTKSGDIYITGNVTGSTLTTGTSGNSTINSKNPGVGEDNAVNSKNTGTDNRSGGFLNEPRAMIFAAIITGVFTIGAALIAAGVIPPDGDETPTPTIATTEAPTVTLPVETETPTPSPTETTVPTDTDEPSHTPTDQPTETETEIVAPPVTDIDEPKPDPNGMIEIIRDEQQLVVYVPEGTSVDLGGLAFEVNINGELETFSLSNYDNFLLAFGNVIDSPTCFRLVISNRSNPQPLSCNGIQVFPQNVANADIFWYDQNGVQLRPLNVILDGENIAVCPNERCVISLGGS